jgi:hypothetical protein
MHAMANGANGLILMFQTDTDHTWPYTDTKPKILYDTCPAGLATQISNDITPMAVAAYSEKVQACSAQGLRRWRVSTTCATIEARIFESRRPA